MPGMNIPAGIVTCKVNTAGFNNKIARVKGRLREAMVKEADNLALQYSYGLKESIIEKQLIWTWRLYQYLGNIRKYSGRNSETRAILIPQYGFAIDSMRPHPAPAFKPPLSDWIASRQDAFIKSFRTRRGKISSAKWLYVRPRPWISYGMRKGRMRVAEIKKDGEVKRAVRSVGI